MLSADNTRMWNFLVLLHFFPIIMSKIFGTVPPPPFSFRFSNWGVRLLSFYTAENKEYGEGYFLYNYVLPQSSSLKAF